MATQETLITLLKEKYDYENERKRYYDNILTLPITLLTFIIAGIYFIINEIVAIQWFNDIKPWFIYPLIATTAISMVLLFVVFFGLKRTYCSFPSSSTILSDLERIRNSFSELPDDSLKEEKINDRLNEFTVCWYTDVNDNNIKVNDLRGNYLFYSKIFIGVSYILVFIIFLFYINIKLNMAKQPANPQPTQPVSPSPVRREKSDQIVPNTQTKSK
jgi:hypothetical protein